jgi:hypothetical protein
VNAELRLPSRGVGILRLYARLLLAVGAAGAVAAVLLHPPEPSGWAAAGAGALAVAALRLGAVSLSKFAYVTMAVVPVGALVVLGEPAAAVLAAWVGTAAGDAARRKPLFAAAVNAGREALAALAGWAGYALAASAAALPPTDPGAGTVPAFTVAGLPILPATFLAYFLASRGLFYFSLLFRGKLTSSERMVLVRYEVVSAGLGALAALATAAAATYLDPAVAVMALASFVVLPGLVARRLLVEAIHSEELRKVAAMEAVITAGMPLSESMHRIEELAGRLIEWSRLHVYCQRDGRLVLVHPAAPAGPEPAGLAELRAEVFDSGQPLSLDDAWTDPRLEQGGDIRALLLKPLA